MSNKTFIALIAIVFLSGCSSNRSSADCKVGNGASCKSITQVNKMVSNGILGAEDSEEPEPNLQPISLDYSAQENLPDAKIVVRTPERTGRVWMNGFEDEEGDYVKETYVYVVLEGGRWVDVK